MTKSLLFVLLCCFSIASFAQTFTFTAIPDEDESRLVARFSKVAGYLENQLGIEVKYIPVKSYAAAVTAFRNNQVQLAWFGGLSGVQARLQVPGSQALAQGFEDQLFKSYLIAHHTSGLKKSDHIPEGIRNKTFTFGSKGSTSGRLMPEYYIREHFKAAPEDIFKRVGFSGDHSMTIAQVQSGAYQVGAVNYLVWKNELEAGKIDLKKVQVIWETPQYPDYQWTIRGDADKQFGRAFTEKVRSALLNMSDPELLASFPRKSFIPAQNENYQAIEETARTLQIIR